MQCGYVNKACVCKPVVNTCYMYPEDWDDQAGGQLFYKAFTDQLSEKHKKDTKELMEIFYKRMDLLDEMLTMEELNKFNP